MHSHRANKTTPSPLSRIIWVGQLLLLGLLLEEVLEGDVRCCGCVCVGGRGWQIRGLEKQNLTQVHVASTHTLTDRGRSRRACTHSGWS